jgi:hypothetical protein
MHGAQSACTAHYDTSGVISMNKSFLLLLQAVRATQRDAAAQKKE